MERALQANGLAFNLAEAGDGPSVLLNELLVEVLG
jgi:hypothetical protein